MKRVISVFWGEMRKQQQNYNNNWQSCISLGLWPILTAVAAYFTYYSFDIWILKPYGLVNVRQLSSFIFSGLLGYNCFWSMVQSAMFIQKERENGTLEIIFLTPATRMALVYGRAFGGIIQNAITFTAFSIIILLINIGWSYKMLFYILISFIILLVSSVIWGGFINSIFMISRDVTFWFNICDEPMILFSGAKLPIQAFPAFMRIISNIFPLTYCLVVVRKVFMQEKIDMIAIVELVVVLIVLIFFTKVLLNIAEKNNRKNGNFEFY